MFCLGDEGGMAGERGDISIEIDRGQGVWEMSEDEIEAFAETIMAVL